MTGAELIYVLVERSDDHPDLLDIVGWTPSPDAAKAFRLGGRLSADGNRRTSLAVPRAWVTTSGDYGLKGRHEDPKRSDLA